MQDQEKEKLKKEEIQKENEAWARFLYKQYKKKKRKESLKTIQITVE